MRTKITHKGRFSARYDPGQFRFSLQGNGIIITGWSSQTVLYQSPEPVPILSRRRVREEIWTVLNIELLEADEGD
ncbi:hypothetical protein PR048_020249 [Dryococelus australis]|uniref:Uncharacterized protein n=1 Tax=Dryococelus australis TaxID=614101 RepID=A0ABQ9H5S9_9NEOP|nr:hypothetical protein PR048_020249 [Dryococelus australis]